MWGLMDLIKKLQDRTGLTVVVMQDKQEYVQFAADCVCRVLEATNSFERAMQVIASVLGVN
jgi:ABC-type methionine transport system ATPase subunit